MVGLAAWGLWCEALDLNGTGQGPIPPRWARLKRLRSPEGAVQNSPGWSQAEPRGPALGPPTSPEGAVRSFDLPKVVPGDCSPTEARASSTKAKAMAFALQIGSAKLSGEIECQEEPQPDRGTV